MRKLTMPELDRLSLNDYISAKKLPVVIVLDNIRSLSNVGAFFRTADAFRVKELYLCGITACPPHREIHKTALGADESVSWSYFPSTEEACKKLRQDGYEIYAVEQIENSVMLDDFVPMANSAYILGNEVEGVSEEALPYCRQAIEIPQAGTKHSLNVSVTAGIIMYKLYNHLNIFL